jgi:hypothetical protein
MRLLAKFESHLDHESEAEAGFRKLNPLNPQPGFENRGCRGNYDELEVPVSLLLSGVACLA